MIHSFLYKTGLHTLFIKMFGTERGTKALMNNIDFTCPMSSKILDVGCGTGAIGLALLKRFPEAFLLATDIEENLLQETARNSQRMKISQERFQLGLSDINAPTRINLLSGSFLSLNKNSFDLVCAGSVIGYAKNQERTMKTLLRLVKSNGYFVNIEMNETLFGKIVSRLYGYPVMPLYKMKKTIEREGYDVKLFPLSSRYFPTNLTRIVLVAKKTAETNDVSPRD
jgi:ubiquinone/menaquinone biosynthesis C-methylase UbiE